MSRKQLQMSESNVDFSELQGPTGRDCATATDSESESQEPEWLPHIKDVLGLLSDDDKLLNFGIYTVPARFKSSPASDDALSPRIVSIGHFHNGMPGSLAMQEQKLFYLTFLLHRTENAVKTFNGCCEAIFCSEHFSMYARNFGYDSKSTENKLIEIMLIDGCFVLELLLRFSYPDMIDKDDVVLKNDWYAPTLTHDLLLLQNQIPKFVFKILVEKISRVSYEVEGQSESRSIDLTMEVFEQLSSNFFRTCVDEIVHGHAVSRKPLHFLDMLHLAFSPPGDSNKHGDRDRDPLNKTSCQDHRTVQMGREDKTLKLKHCTRLVADGVKIEKAAEGRHLLDLSFDGGTLTIPPLRVDLNTWSVLKNLVVFEQCSVDRSHHVTSYAVVLRNLIRTKRDVELLVQKKILDVDLPEENGGVLAFVECVVSGMVIRDFTYQKLFDELKAHSEPWWRWHKLKALWELSWHEYKRILKDQYFPHPWRVIQFGVASLLLLFTALQTYYTMF